MIGNGGQGANLIDIVNGSPDSAVNKFGFNNDVDTAASEDIWSAGGLYPFSTFATAKTLEVVSSSGSDASGGTGAITMKIQGLDENLLEKEEEITLTGLVAVVLSGSWLAVNRAFILTAGTGQSNAGIISIQVSVGGTKVSEIPAERGQTQQCVYRVPAEKTLRIVNIIAYTDAAVGKTGSMQLVQVCPDCQTTRILSSGTITESSAWTREYKKGGKQIPAGSWVSIRAFAVAQNDTAITADFDGVLE